MQKIYEFALSKVQVNPDQLCDLLDQLDGEQGERIISVLIGIINPKDVENTLPKSGNYLNEENGSVCTLESYNYVKDEVRYSYVRREYRRFKTEEAATEYKTSGNYPWNQSQSGQTPTEEFPFVVFRDCNCHSSCSANDWVNRIDRNSKRPAEEQYILVTD